MVDQIKIELPLPHARLWSNRNTHWRVKAPLIKKYRYLAYRAMNFEMARLNETGWQRGKLSMNFFFKDRRRRDVYNAAQAMKAGIDGCIDAGILPDDDWQHLEGGGLTGSVDKENPGVIMIFDRLG